MKVSKHISTVFLTSTFASILLFALIFWVYSNSDSKTLIVLKDALSTTSGFFGGITTLIAAYIASKLFNDWKVQHNKTVIAADARKAFKLLHDERNYLNDLRHHLKEMHGISPAKFFTVNDDNMSQLIRDLINIHNQNRFELAEFVYLSQSYDSFKTINNYRESINTLMENTNTWNASVKKYDDVLDIYQSNITNSILLNSKALDCLSGFVLYKNTSLI